MTDKQPLLDVIDRRLRTYGLSGLAAALLEAFAPLAPVGAQLAYILKPMVDAAPGGWMSQLGALLERPDELASLTDRLRKGSP
jgi:hypothetical protein